MRIAKFILAAGLALATVAGASTASAQDRHHRGDRYEQRHDRYDRYDRGRHHGWDNGRRNHGWNRHHRNCRTFWRHHRRVTVCR